MTADAPVASPGKPATTPPVAADRLPLRVKLGYGGGEWANSVVWTLFYALFLYFLTDVVGIGAATAGLIMMVGTLWSAVFQPLVGVWSDRVRSSRGRRRPFLIAVALPYGVASLVALHQLGPGDSQDLAYMVVAVLFYFTCLALFYVPYGALAAELTSGYDERTSLNTFRTLFAQVGALVGAAAPLALNDVLGDLLGGERAGWSAAAAIMGAVSTLGILWTWRATSGREQHFEAASVRLRDVFATLFRNRSFRYLLVAYVLGWAPLNVIGAVSIYFAVYRMGYSEDYASLVMLTWFLVGVAWLPLVDWMSKRYGKRATYIVFTLTWPAIQVPVPAAAPGGRRPLLDRHRAQQCGEYGRRRHRLVDARGRHQRRRAPLRAAPRGHVLRRHRLRADGDGGAGGVAGGPGPRAGGLPGRRGTDGRRHVGHPPADASRRRRVAGAGRRLLLADAADEAASARRCSPPSRRARPASRGRATRCAPSSDEPHSAPVLAG